jgi:hypothetical protein
MKFRKMGFLLMLSNVYVDKFDWIHHTTPPIKFRFTLNSVFIDLFSLIACISFTNIHSHRFTSIVWQIHQGTLPSLLKFFLNWITYYGPLGVVLCCMRVCHCWAILVSTLCNDDVIYDVTRTFLKSVYTRYSHCASPKITTAPKYH